MTNVCGGFTNDVEFAALSEEQQNQISGNLESLRETISIQTEVGDFLPLTYATQVVAGLNYRVTLQHSEGRTYTVKYHRNLNGELSLMEVVSNQRAGSE